MLYLQYASPTPGHEKIWLTAVFLQRHFPIGPLASRQRRNVSL